MCRGCFARLCKSTALFKMAGQERLENVNPEVFEKAGERPVLPEEMDDTVADEIDVREIFGKLVVISWH